MFQQINSSKIFTSLVEVFHDYADNSKLNGIYYLRRNQTSGFSRFLWICIPIVLIIFGTWLVILLYADFTDSPTVMTMDTPLPCNKVPFPAITLCHPQTVLDYKAQQFVEKIRIPLDVDKDALLESLQYLGGFVENRWGNVPNLEELDVIDRVLDYNNYTVVEAIKQVGMDCNDFLKTCGWAKVGYPCFDKTNRRSFSPSISYLGVCCSFNYNLTNESFVPFNARTFGHKGGLSVIGTSYPQVSDGKSGVLFSSGLMMLIHHPLDYPVEGDQMVFIKMGKITSVAIYPEMIHHSEDLLGLSPTSRNCLVPSDIGKQRYRQPDCAMNCVINLIYKLCKCHPFFLPYPEDKEPQIKDCRARDAACVAANFLTVKRTKCGNCLPSCIDISYSVSSFYNDYYNYNDTYNISPVYNGIEISDKHFTVHMYLAGQVIKVQKKIVSTSFISLLSNLGGVFNLCLGISILSLIEVLYFFGYKLMVKIFSEAPVNKRQHNSSLIIVKRFKNTTTSGGRVVY